MNIYISFLQSKIQHPIPAYSFWEYYIKNGIEEAGYKWEESDVDWAEGLMYSLDKEKLNHWKTEAWEKTVDDIKKKHQKNKLSIFLTYLYPHQVDEQAIKEIQKLGILCVNFFCDNVRDFTKIPKEYGVFDLNWVPENKALDMYKKANYPYIHLPMPMWVAPKYRILPNIENNYISFIGSKDVQRYLLFESLSEQNLNLNIYGAGWQNNQTRSEKYVDPKSRIIKTINNQFAFLTKYGVKSYLRKLQQRNMHLVPSSTLQKYLKGKPNFNEYINITQQSIITIGVNRYPSFNYPLNKPNSYSRLRDIEAPMLGACYLTEYTAGLENMYDIGNEIETYSSKDELIDKINYLTSNTPKRNSLRINGQKRAMQNYSIYNSIQLILNKIK